MPCCGVEGKPMKSLLALLFFLSASSEAKTTYELYADCANHCAFREFPDNCHGIAFKSSRNGENDILYTSFLKPLNACFYARPPYYKTIKMGEVKQVCNCDHLPVLPTLPDPDAPMTEQTRNELIALKERIEEWAPCATDPMRITPVNEDGKFSITDQGVCKNMKNGYIVLGGCEQGMDPSFCVFYGNTNNIAGPYCLAGDLDRCKDVALAQDPTTGAWYRNAYQRRDPLSERGQPLFSRDEFLGVMLYLAKTKDKDSAMKWMQFIEKNPRKFLSGPKKDIKIKVYNICPSHGVNEKPESITDKQWEDMQPDDRCEMRPNDWVAMYETYKHIGFTDQDLKSMSAGIYARMLATKPIMSVTSLVSAGTVPARNYQLALQATMILLYREIGFKGNLNPPQGGRGTPSAAYFDSASHTFGGINNGYETNLPIGHDCIGWINLYLNASKQ